MSDDAPSAVLTGTLRRSLNLSRPDDIYNAIVDAHKGLSDEQCRAFDARLILRIAPAVARAAAESGVATRPGVRSTPATWMWICPMAVAMTRTCTRWISRWPNCRSASHPNWSSTLRGLMSTNATAWGA